LPRIKLLVLILLLCPATLSFASDTPDWVKAAARIPVPAIKAHTPGIVLSQENLITVQDNGKLVERTRVVYKILTKDGRDFGVQTANYDKDSKISSLHAWTLTPDGQAYEVKQGDAVDKIDNPDFSEGFSDQRRKVIAAMFPEPGNVVAFEIEKHDRPYILVKLFALQYEGIPVLQRDVIVTLPSGWTYAAYWSHAGTAVTPEQNGSTYHWHFGAAPAIDFEDQPLHPKWEAIAPRMILDLRSPGRPDQAGSWLNTGEWLDGLIGDRTKPSPEVASKAAELTAGKSGFLDKVSAITSFLQSNIRYYGIEIGISGFQPHPADEIFRNRYGDCKDKTTLLIAMLSVVNIKAYPVLVDTSRGAIESAVASPYANHMIAAIQVPKEIADGSVPGIVKLTDGNRVMIFDATDQLLPVGQIPAALQGSYGLLVDGTQSQLIAIPVLPPELNTEHFSGHFTLDEHGGLSGNLTATSTGAPMEPWRDLFVSTDEHSQRRFFENYLTSYLAGPTLEKFSAEDAKGHGDKVTIQITFKVPDYAKNAGGMLLVRPRVIHSDYHRVSNRVEREYPVEFDNTIDASEDFVIKLPPGYVVEELPDPVNLDVGFAAYSSRTEHNGDELRFVRDYRLKQTELSKDQYGKLRELMSQIKSDEINPVMLKKAN